MNKPKLSLLTFLIVTLVFSCQTKPVKELVEKDKETPEALQATESRVSNFKYRDNLLDALYKELVDKSPELKKLEDDLEALQSNTKEATAEYSGYDAKSTDFYSSADALAASIEDTVLKRRIIELVSSNKVSYTKRNAEYNAILKQSQKAMAP